MERYLLWAVVIFVGYKLYKHFTRPAKQPAKAGSSTGPLVYGSPSLR